MGTKPAPAVMGEVAPPLESTLYLSPYVGELDPDPRRPRSRYAVAQEDQSYYLQLYRSVLRDDRCVGALDQRRNAAAAKPWEVLPGGDKRRDKVAAEAVAEDLARLPFIRRCRQLLYYSWYGFSVGELIWGIDGGRVRLLDIRVRSPERFAWSPSGDLLLRTATRPQGAPVPDRKFILLIREAEHGDVPHAPGLAWWCYWPVLAKRLDMQFWATALQRFGSPVPMGHYPPSDNDGAAKLIQLLEGYAGGRAMALPEGMEVTILDSVRRTGGDYSAFLTALNQAITTIILGQSSTTDQGPWRGTAEVQKDVRDEVVATDAGILDEALTETAARWLTEWNFPGAAPPRVHHDAEPPEDLDRRSEREERVARTSGLRPTRTHVENVYGGEWEPAPSAPTPTRPEIRAPGAAFAQGGADAIAAASEELTEDWRPLVGKLPDGDTPEAFRQQTAALMAEPPPEALRSRLNNASFSAGASAQAEEP